MAKRQAAPEVKDLSGLQEESSANADEGSTGSGGRVTSKDKARRWRRILAWVFLVLGCIILPLAIMGAWIRGTIFDTDGFERTMAPLASQPAVQRMVSDVLTVQLTERLALEQRLREALPDGLDFVAPTISDRVDGWIHDQVEAVVASDEFATIWRKSLVFAHSTISDFIRGESVVGLGEDGVVQLDLSPVTERINARLEEAGVSLPANAPAVLEDGKVPLIQVTGLEKIKSLLSTLNSLFILLPILALVFLAGSVAVVDRRQRAVARLGSGIMISMAVLIVILALARLGIVHLITKAGSEGDVGREVWNTLTIALRGAAWGMFLLGLILFMAPRIVRGLRGERFSQTAGRAAGAGWVVSRPVAWLAAHRTPVAVVILVAAFLVLAFWTGPGLVSVLVVFLITVILEVALFFAAKAHDAAVAAAPAEPEVVLVAAAKPAAKPAAPTTKAGAKSAKPAAPTTKAGAEPSKKDTKSSKS